MSGKQNIDLRIEIMKSGLYHYQIAEKMNITESTFSKLLRVELPMETKENIRKMIAELKMD